MVAAHAPPQNALLTFATLEEARYLARAAQPPRYCYYLNESLPCTSRVRGTGRLFWSSSSARSSATARSLRTATSFTARSHRAPQLRDCFFSGQTDASCLNQVLPDSLSGAVALEAVYSQSVRTLSSAAAPAGSSSWSPVLARGVAESRDGPLLLQGGRLGGAPMRTPSPCPAYRRRRSSAAAPSASSSARHLLQDLLLMCSPPAPRWPSGYCRLLYWPLSSC